jgi:hypothetical protein
MTAPQVPAFPLLERGKVLGAGMAGPLTVATTLPTSAVPTDRTDRFTLVWCRLLPQAERADSAARPPIRSPANILIFRLGVKMASLHWFETLQSNLCLGGGRQCHAYATFRSRQRVHAFVEQRFQFYCRNVAQLKAKAAYRRRDSEISIRKESTMTIRPSFLRAVSKKRVTQLFYLSHDCCLFRSGSACRSSNTMPQPSRVRSRHEDNIDSSERSAADREQCPRVTPLSAQAEQTDL